jgi:hypothetical protein
MKALLLIGAVIVFLALGIAAILGDMFGLFL